MINVLIANQKLKNINILKILQNIQPNEEFKEVEDINDAQIVFVSNYDEYKNLNESRKSKENSPHYFFLWQWHSVSDMENFSRCGDFRFLRGYFLIDDLEENEFFIESVNDALRKIKKRELWQAKQREILEKGEYKLIGDIVKFNNPEEKPQSDNAPNFETLFFDKKMFKVMQAISAVIDNRKEIFSKIVSEYEPTIKNLKEPEKKLFKDGKINLKNIEKILVFRDKKDGKKIDPLLLEGETGVGKTLITRWLYKRLEDIFRQQKKEIGAYIEINSSSFTSNLLETELFGSCEGAFTGAKDKLGKALLAFGGILFVDEIGDMPLDVQTKFLKFVEEKIFVPEGWQDPRYIYCPVFIIAATNKDLKKEVEEGRFRKDLYARFIDRIRIPSLNERKASIIPIVDYYFQKELKNKPKISKISKTALNKFREFDYSDGNFRFFERLIKRIINKVEKYDLEVIIEDVVQEIYDKIKNSSK